MGHHGRTKPPFGTTIDRSHPTAAGLVGIWPLSEGGGLPYDAVTNRRATLVSGSLSWGAGSISGTALAETLGTGPIYSLQHANIDRAGPLTALVWTRFDSLPVSFPYLSALVCSADANYFFRLGDANLAHNAFLNLQYFNGSSGPEVTSTSGVTVGRPTCIGMTQALLGGNVTQAGYIDGVPVCSQVTPARGTAVNETSTYLFTDNGGNDGRQPQGPTDQVALWNRPLSQAEVQWLTAEPFAMFAAPRRNARAFVLSGGAPLTPYRTGSVFRPAQLPTADLICYQG